MAKKKRGRTAAHQVRGGILPRRRELKRISWLHCVTAGALPPLRAPPASVAELLTTGAIAMRRSPRLGTRPGRSAGRPGPQGRRAGLRAASAGLAERPPPRPPSTHGRRSDGSLEVLLGDASESLNAKLARLAQSCAPLPHGRANLARAQLAALDATLEAAALLVIDAWGCSWRAAVCRRDQRGGGAKWVAGWSSTRPSRASVWWPRLRPCAT